VEPLQPLESTLSEYVARVCFADLPAHVVEAAKRVILDTLGAILAGARGPGCAELSSLVGSWGGVEQATLFDSGLRVPAHSAALVNAAMARSLEIADVHEPALMYTTATMLPVALAVAEAHPRCSGAELVTAVTLGIDVAARLGRAPHLSDEANQRPMSHTFQMGGLGAAVVAGKLQGLSAEGLRNAMGIAYSQCAGNQQSIHEGALTAAVQQGITASTGILSTSMHLIGITGPLEFLEGVYGLYNAFYRGDYDRQVITAGLGTAYEVEQLSIKPYPCCKLAQTGVVAALNASASAIDPSAIERIEVRLDNHASYDLVCQPEDRQERRRRLHGPRAGVFAQFCLPYLVAVALTRGAVTLADFQPDRLGDDRVLSLMDKVVTTLDQGNIRTTQFPAPVTVDVFTGEGATAAHGFADVVKGHPAAPMSFADVAHKFLEITDVVADRYPVSRRLRIVDSVASLDLCDDVSDLVSLVAGRPSNARET
jgi:2-methylcitrate dehydratase PrpD